MKKIAITILAAMSLMLTSCFSTGYGNTGYGNTGYGTGMGGSGNVLGNVLGSVLGNILLGGGGMMLEPSSLLGNWTYNAPSAAFTTEQTFTKAGGATAIKQMAAGLASNYASMGINRNNTSFSFLDGNKFSAKVNGIPFDGTYTYSQQNGEIVLKTAAQNLKGNVARTEKGMELMFDAGQMTNLLQKVGHVSNTAAVQAVSKLAKSQNGARVGFELTK
ncbi:MAG: DUF4923 family protein [Muribaculaceae bacterium]|nr:DUF4923 family protein [Muribaculaceae bacterium]